LDTSDNELLLDRLERLVRKFLAGEFRGARGLWKIEIDLLELLSEVQEKIAVAKRQGKQIPAKRDELTFLRQVRWRCLRFGDAFAWVLFRANRKLLVPLGQNARVPITRDDDGRRGMLAIASVLSEQNWGFPVLHDITDCLRIGDISFVREDSEIRTIEVKTSLLHEAHTADGVVSDYSVQVLFHLGAEESLPDVGPPVANAEAKQEGGRRTTSSPGRRSSRIDRQLDRMADAFRRQTAAPGLVTETGGRPLLTTEFVFRHAGHSNVVKRCVRRARRSGYASETVESAILYAAFYQAEGITEETLQDGRILYDLSTSHILTLTPPEKNGILIYAIPPEERGSSPHEYIPFYLYPLPRTSIIDMLRGRLVIVVLLNPGRVVTALEEAGFGLSADEDGSVWPSGRLHVEADIDDEDGVRYRVRLGNLHRHIAEIIYEFHSIQAIVDVAQSLRDAAQQAVHLLREGN
jgi:hypothetical protein